MGTSKNRDTSSFSSMTCIRCKASNRSNTVCISRFDNTADDTSHRKAAVKEDFRGNLILFNIEKSAGLCYNDNIENTRGEGKPCMN